MPCLLDCIQDRQIDQKVADFCEILAERVGFEPTVRLPVQRVFETALSEARVLPIAAVPRYHRA